MTPSPPYDNSLSRAERHAARARGDHAEEYVALCLRQTPADLATCRADLHEAIRLGAVQGPGSLWPDPRIAFPRKQTPFEVHWVHAALQLTVADHAALRAKLEAALAARRSQEVA